MKITQIKTPELNKLAAVSKESQALGEFLDWLQNEKSFVFCESVEGLHVDSYAPTVLSNEKILAQYFQIDLDKVERERRALLKHLQEQYDDPA